MYTETPRAKRVFPYQSLTTRKPTIAQALGPMLNRPAGERAGDLFAIVAQRAHLSNTF